MADLVFPSDRAKELRDSPKKRYSFAVRYLPLPAAFREAAKGLRQQIRDARRDGESYQPVLKELYRLACLNDMAFDLLAETGYQWRDPIPQGLWRSWSFNYDEIGHEHLELLGVTDRKWIEESWGAPQDHRRVLSVAPEAASELRGFLRESGAKSEREFQERMKQLSATKPAEPGCIVALLSAPWAMILQAITNRPW